MYVYWYVVGLPLPVVEFTMVGFWYIFRARIPQHFTTRSQGGILVHISCQNPPTFHLPFAGWDSGTYFVPESPNISPPLRRVGFWYIFRA